MSETERRGIEPGFLAALFDGLLPLSLPLKCSKALILETAMRGGYLDVLAINDSESRSRWYRSYLQNHILRDMRKARDMRKLDVVARVLESVATYSDRALSKADVDR